MAVRVVVMVRITVDGGRVMSEVFTIVVGYVTTSVFVVVKKISDVNVEMSTSVEVENMSRVTVSVSKTEVVVSTLEVSIETSTSVSREVTKIFEVKVETYVMMDVKFTVT